MEQNITFTGDAAIATGIFLQLEAWAKHNYAFQQMWQMLKSSNLTVHIGDEQSLLSDRYNNNKTLTEYSGYALHSDIYLFFTRYHTIESISALLLHEICHICISANPLTMLLFHSLNGQCLSTLDKSIDTSTAFWGSEGYCNLTKRDDVHELIPEERICNQFAASVTGKDYGKTWWKSNIAKVDALQTKMARRP